MIEDHHHYDSYTVAEANALSGLQAGDMIFVSNETGGANGFLRWFRLEKNTR